jgi:hypothetical protein
MDDTLGWLRGRRSLRRRTGDINAWLRHVKVGGFVSFHDYDDAHWPAVKPVVDEMMASHEYLPEYSAYKLRTYRKVDG